MMSGPYEAIGTVIRKKPVQTKTETGTSFEIGFPACEVTEYLDEDGAKAVAGLMNRGDVLPEVIEALKELLEAYSKPDERLCCDGRDCGCMGSTVRQQAEHYARAAIAKAEGRS